MSPAHGVLVVDKPRGPTSHDIVSRIRRLYRTRRVGHAGTLDPMATGVLVLLLGEATKLSSVLTTQSKEYEAAIELGVETDTLDAEGQITKRRHTPPPSLEALQSALDGERARTLQVPPAVSAIKVEGRRAYALARAGQPPDLEPRLTAVHALELLAHDGGQLRVRLVVSKGYYVRSLARDLAAALGTVGHLTELRRLASGRFSIEQARPFPLERPAPLLSLTEAVRLALPHAELSDEGAQRASHGQFLRRSDLLAPPPSPPGPLALLHQGRLVALAEAEPAAGTQGPEIWRILRGFVEPENSSEEEMI